MTRRLLPALAFLAVVLAVIRSAFYTPLEAKQGAAQKIFYIHVPAAWVAFLAFFIVAVASGIYLWVRDPRLDQLAESSAEVGVSGAPSHATGPATSRRWLRPRSGLRAVRSSRAWHPPSGCHAAL